ncbi:tRNA-binding protein, partial [Escherichia coli]|uniref:tRNA-binding protein n=1 Tax=Escherichia coli TaxID=562 RepID=UPI0024AFF8D8
AQGQQLLQVAQQALALQSDYITQQTGISLATALPSASEADHWLMMAGFAFAHRSILTAYQSVGYFLQGDRSRYPLLVAFFIDKQSVEA